MTLKTVNNSDPGTADTVGGNDWDEMIDFVKKSEYATFVVYKSGSDYYLKDVTNGGVTSSTALASLINTKLTTLDTTGARFFFRKGTYTVGVGGTSGGTGIDYGLLIPQTQNNIEFIGEGWGTVLQSIKGDMLMVRDGNGPADGTHGTYAKVANMTLDGNKANNTAVSGITILTFSRKSDVYFENLHVINSAWQGFGINGEGGRPTFAGYGSERAWFNNCLVENCNGNGIDSPCWYLRIHNCATRNNAISQAAGNSLAGLDFDGSTWCHVSNFYSEGDWNGIVIGGAAAGRPSQSHRFTNIIVKNAIRDGFWNAGSYQTVLDNFHIENPGRHGLLYNTTSYENVISNGIVSNCAGTGGMGIQIDNSLKPIISNVHVKTVSSSGGNGIYIVGGSNNAVINNCLIEGINNGGIVISAATFAQISNCRIIGCTNLDGIRIQSAANGVQVSNCVISDARHGIGTSAVTDLLLQGVTCYSNKQRGFNIFGGMNTRVIGCRAYDNGTSAANSYDGFLFDGDGGSNGPSDNCLILACRAYDSNAVTGSKTQRYGIAFTSFANNNMVAFCDFVGNRTGALSNAGTSNVLKESKGYVTSNYGSSTQSGDGSTKVFNIAHGLGSAPTYPIAVASSDDAMGIFKVTSDATNVVVTYAIAPPSGSSNLIWKWRGDV